MRTFKEWRDEVFGEAKKGPLPPVKETGFWTDEFGEGKVDDASAEDLFAHAKKHPDGLLGGIRSLQLIASYGSFPESKMKKLWDMYNKEKKED